MEERHQLTVPQEKAHDQETQTTFDVNNSTGGFQPLGLQNTDRGYPNYTQSPWRYPTTLSENHYQYDNSYPTPPSPHHGAYYPGKSPHWHHQERAAVYPQSYAPHMPPPAHIKPSELPPRGFGHPQEPPAHIHETPIARPKPEWPVRAHHPFPKPIIPSLYLASMHNAHRNVHSEYGGPPSTATSLRSTVLDVNGTNISSPRASAHLNRKRARSNTPSSIESIDLNLLIRNSPDSLLGCLVTGSRLSSSGSFGHLSPQGFCTSSAFNRANSCTRKQIPFITPPPIEPTATTLDQQRDAFPTSTTDIPKKEVNDKDTNCIESPASTKKTEGPQKMKEETMETKLDSTTSPGASDLQVS